MAISEEFGDVFIPGIRIGANQAALFDVFKEKSVQGALFTVRNGPKGDLTGLTFKPANDDLLVTITPSANERLIDLDYARKLGPFLYRDQFGEPSEPAPDRRRRESGDSFRVLERKLMEPTTHELPENLKRKPGMGKWSAPFE
jgi:hypothetical protein